MDLDIEKILTEEGIEYKRFKQNEIVIKCTSGDHIDKNPSLRYNLEQHIFNCFSCGFSGNYRKFLRSIGRPVSEDVASKQSYEILKLKNKLAKKTASTVVRMPALTEPYMGPLKGINAETIHEFEAFTTKDLALENYICFPIYQYKKLKFIEARHRLNSPPEGTPRYLRKPEDVKASRVLFPLDKITDRHNVILVEGLTDMLNMWQYGYTNVLCIFGINNFGKEKIQLLNDVGVTHATLMFDGDLAGRNGTNKIGELLETSGIKTQRILLAQDHDPGMLTGLQIKEYMQSLYE